MNDTVILPRKLTAENGAKALLIGEFSQKFPTFCYECMGEGVVELEDGNKYMCKECEGRGEYTEEINISWVNIKKIYDTIVKNLEIKNES